ncbi:hypothetical protein PACTADRAFT_140434 [Pachysolen tannophilus NRRL Y-2460]|uniref:Mitochondrial phosphate carrier protein n=1 Tax=Pachysolen tannophilus NRRL Y-2460 TaxID=669874 RepID=A0A1E4U0W6_PACTA|nr:hypothetical protein PACTADRAFT_140434 [Pachysolen tannophilus NRRL Y-2460]
MSSATVIATEPNPQQQTHDPSHPQSAYSNRQVPSSLQLQDIETRDVSQAMDFNTTQYYLKCAVGGSLAGALTNTLVCPLDVVKVRKQVYPNIYKNTFQSIGVVWKNEGFRGLFSSATSVMLGYGIQGGAKYGFYEFFKFRYTDLLGPDASGKYQSLIYLSAGASAELIADVLYCPVESVKIRMQTTIPTFASGPIDGLRKIIKSEGFGALYKGLIPLWSRQLPFTMTKFTLFENVVSAIYKKLPREKEDYNHLQQTGISFLAGYIAGIACALVSHPPDVMFSKMNAMKKAPGDTTNKLLTKIYKEIGFRGLWNGLPVRIFMIGTLTGLQWLVYDSFKVMTGLPTTGK